MQTIAALAFGIALPLAAQAAPDDMRAAAKAAEHQCGTQLAVNDADAVGTVGDRKLSLAEAIRLANGSLALAALSNHERAQVQGQPGALSRDKIVFKVRGGAIRFPLQIQEKPASDFTPLTPSTLMPVLVGNDGDAIIGNGVRFTNGPDDAVDTVNNPQIFVGAPLGGLGLQVSSSNVLLTGITFERFITPLTVEPAVGGIANVKIIGNKFYNGGGLNFSATLGGAVKSSLRGVVVADNDLLGPPLFGEHFPSELHSAISVTGATSGTAFSFETAVVDDIRVVGNTIREYAGGVQAQALQGIFLPNSGAQMSKVHIERNRIALRATAGDPAIYLWGGVTIFTGVSNVQVSDLLVRDNDVVGNGHVVFITGVETLFGGQPSSDINIDGVKVIGNRIRPASQCSIGITTIAAFPEMGGGAVTDSSMNGVEVAGNRIEGCAWGAFAAPVYNWGTPGTSTGNEMAGVAFRKNQITGATDGIVVAGGSLVAAAPGDATTAVVGNELSALTIEHNRFAASGTGFTVAGGLASGSAPGFVSQNAVGANSLAHNVNTGDGVLCRIANNLVIDSPATVADNSVTGAAAALAKGKKGKGKPVACVAD